MSLESEVPQGEVVSYPVDSMEPMSFEDAVRDLGSARDKALNPTAESAETATADTELAVEASAAPPEEAHGEDEGLDPANEPPIERPKSWTESEDAEWQSTPRALQQKIVARELERDTALRRTQNEAAEKLKGLTAKEQQLSELTNKLAAKLPELETSAQDFFTEKYPEFKTYDDVVKMTQEAYRLSQTDPFTALELGNRVKAWEADQNMVGLKLNEARAAATRQQQEKQQKRVSYEAEQTVRLKELVPEFSDDKKYINAKERAVKMLNEDLGLSNDQLGRWMQDDTGHEILSNAGIQKLMVDGLKLREIQNASKAAAAKPLPTVQRPGTSKPAGSNVASQIQALEKQLSSASGDKAARISADIWRLEKKAASR